MKVKFILSILLILAVSVGVASSASAKKAAMVKYCGQWGPIVDDGEGGYYRSRQCREETINYNTWPPTTTVTTWTEYQEIHS